MSHLVIEDKQGCRKYAGRVVLGGRYGRRIKIIRVEDGEESMEVAAYLLNPGQKGNFHWSFELLDKDNDALAIFCLPWPMALKDKFIHLSGHDAKSGKAVEKWAASVKINE